MKTWIKAVWRLDKRLERIASAIDKNIMSAAFGGTGGGVFAQCNKILSLNEAKRAAVNMRVLCNAMRGALGGADTRLMEARFGEDKPVTHIASELGVGRFAAGKRIDAALGACVEAVRRLGYGGADFEADYGGIHIFRSVYDKIAAEEAEPKKRKKADGGEGDEIDEAA